MPILFGWGYQKVKEIGPVTRHDCANCKNNSYWVLYTVSLWFTLFFIPVIPYSTKKFLSCPICIGGIELTDEQFDYFKKYFDANFQYNESLISKYEYQQILSELGLGN